MSYRVFARKYRPQRFSELVGQAPIIQTLQNAITTNRLAQAYLFVGPRGVGKTSTARIFAKALNCVNGPTINPCGTCDACIEIAEGRNLDVLEIDGASNNSVESIRTLRENAAFAPARGLYKIYLIDEVHMLTTAAFNALLKTLEEPPPHVKFIFATTEAQKLPATIISRCQRFDLHRLSEELMAKHLLDIAAKEKITLALDAAQALAHGADGALRDAESMLDQVISFCGTDIQAKDVQEVFGFTPRETVRQLATAVFQQDTPTALTLLLEQSNAGKDLSRLLTDFIGFVRDLLVEKVSPTSDDSFFGELGAMVSTEKLLALLEELGNAEGRLRWATNKKLQLDVVIIKVIHLLQEVSLDDVLAALTDLADPHAVKQPAPQKLKPPIAIEVKKIPIAPAIEKVTTPLPASLPSAEKADVTTENRPLSKFAAGDERQGVDGAQRLSVSLILDDASTGTTQPIAPAVEFGKGSNPWTPVAEQLASESRLKFGWVASGKFLEQRGNKIVVEFPPSCEAQTETLFWPQARKKIQECLSKNGGMPLELVAQFTGEELHHETLEEEMPLPPPPQAAAKAAPSKTTPTAAPPAGTPLTPEALASFKNDPLIQEALEIFKAEIISL
ncbi:MAG: DNA polymerase III subunit gamma/tau [Verrucomicrobiae bacterium]|nr:DNA polymerase III subunit gamma/tau [Verrucomicrobiae bacterium]